jgi:CheY-like chemotaxis protein
LIASSHTVNILLVEDDELEVELVQRAFQKARLANPLYVAADGAVALAMLRGDDGEERVRRPCMILLDLNLPRMNGIGFLRELRNDPNLYDHIVFVLTNSDMNQDKIAAYGLQIAGYILKSNLGDDLMKMISLLQCYWRVIEFPPEPIRC